MQVNLCALRNIDCADSVLLEVQTVVPPVASLLATVLVTVHLECEVCAGECIVRSGCIVDEVVVTQCDDVCLARLCRL